jgi:diadenosine tetraphosphate (Ap4A) HIT family hydrolase
MALAMTKFELAPAFAATTAPLAGLGLCDARLQLDARWPWIVLIPRRAGAREFADLSTDDRAALIEEIVAAGEAVKAIGEALGRPVEKLNTGALGNITPQLHVHLVGRRSDDPAWPGPVWGAGSAVAYEEAVLGRAIAAAVKALVGPPR